jgi:hypothetical protein
LKESRKDTGTKPAATGGHPGRRSCAGRSGSGVDQGVTQGRVLPPLARGALPVKVGFRRGRKDARFMFTFGWTWAVRRELHPGRVPGQRKAPRLSAVSPPFAWHGTQAGVLVGPSSPGNQAGDGGPMTNGVPEDPRGGLCTAACKLATGSLGPCVRRPSGVGSGFGPGHARLTAGRPWRSSPQRIASHRGAREVVAPDRCASDSGLVAEVIERRSAPRSHRGCGRGGGRGPSHGRETGRGERRRQGETPDTVANPNGSRRAARWWKASRAVAAVSLHGSAGKAALVFRIAGVFPLPRGATEASELRPVPRPGRRTGDRGGARAGRSEPRGVNCVTHGE